MAFDWVNSKTTAFAHTNFAIKLFQKLKNYKGSLKAKRQLIFLQKITKRPAECYSVAESLITPRGFTVVPAESENSIGNFIDNAKNNIDFIIIYCIIPRII